MDLLHQYASNYLLPIFDIYTGSALYPWQTDANEYYFKPYNEAQYGTVPDGLHPNDEGHKVLAYRMKNFLESIQRKNSTQ